MSDKQVFVIRQNMPQVSLNCIDAIQRAEGDWVVEIKPVGRTIPQNSLIHAELQSLVTHGVEWAGRARDIEEWKRIFMSGYMRETGQTVSIVHGLDGEFVTLGRSTTKLSKAEVTEFVEYIRSIKAHQGWL